MRNCSRCQAPDRRIILKGEACTCGAEYAEFAPDDMHKPDCQRVGHEVVMYIHPKILRGRDLAKSPDSPHGFALPAHLRKDWTLIERRGVPGQYVRVRQLCQKCVVEQVATEERVEDYDKAKAKLARRGKPLDRNFAALMLSQDALI